MEREQSAKSTPEKLVIGLSGASGVAYGIRLLEALKELRIESHLVMTKPAQLTIEAFAERLSTPSPAAAKTTIRESIHDPVIRIDNDLAVVWAPFDFTIDGKVDHCGTDLFNLMRIDGQWRVTSITWNSRKDCPAH